MAARSIHMACVVEVDEWRPDVIGYPQSLEDYQRVTIITFASKQFLQRNRLPSQNLYWMGKPSDSEHPDHPGKPAYAYSCATFVHNCYRHAMLPIVNTDRLPNATKEICDYLNAQGFRAEVGEQRLMSSYLAFACDGDKLLPYEPPGANWNSCQDSVVFPQLHQHAKNGSQEPLVLQT
jgi:hypothetical protein